MIEAFEQLEPTHGNGLSAQDIMLEDYVRAGVPEDSAYRMIHGAPGKDALTELVQRMEHGPKEYYGVRQNSLLTGFAALGEWYYGDEKPFRTTPEYIAARLLHKANAIKYGESQTEYDGIHAFAVGNDAESYENTAGVMLDGLRRRSAERQKKAIRLSVDAEDEMLLDVLEDLDARTVQSKLGRIPVHGVVRNYFLYELETA